jgi:2-aminobenzoylacetyl-CoA thioesterase
MIFSGTGYVANGLHVAGLAWSPVYLLEAKRPILFEAGFACAGRLSEEAIRAVLHEKQPELLCLTHVHWDHAGAASYLKRTFPLLTVAGSERAAAIMARPNAHALMKRLNANVLPLVAVIEGIDRLKLTSESFEPFVIEKQLHKGDTIMVDEETTLQVLESPGHTRDMLSYYIPERKILIGTEATGCLDRAGTLITEFLVSFDDYLASLKRLAALDAEIVGQGHHFVFVGKEEVKAFFKRSISEAERFRARIYELLEAYEGSVERVVQQIKAEQYDTNTNVKQAEAAYLLNVRAQVTHLAGRLRSGTQ